MYPLELNKVKNTKNLYFPTCDNVSTLSYHMTLYTTMYPFELDKVKKTQIPHMRQCIHSKLSSNFRYDNVSIQAHKVTKTIQFNYSGATMYPVQLKKKSSDNETRDK